jgi:leucyl-tRNA synthetase
MEGKSERKSNAKVSALREIEVDVQKFWKNEKVFEVDAPEVIYLKTDYMI